MCKVTHGVMSQSALAIDLVYDNAKCIIYSESR